MAKINIMGVKSGSKDYQVHVVLTEEIEIEGETVDNPIGEAFIPIAHGTSEVDIKDKILDAANKIMDKHKDSINKRADIETIDFPEIT